MIHLCIRKMVEGTELSSDIFIHVASEVRPMNLLLAAWVCDYPIITDLSPIAFRACTMPISYIELMHRVTLWRLPNLSCTR
jgi:hypothetical protein